MRHTRATCALLAVMCAPVVAQNTPQRDPKSNDPRNTDPRVTQPGQPGTERTPTAGQRAWGMVVQAGTLMGANVHNLNNDKVGDISDLVVDPQTGHVVYGVLSHGGFLGIGDKLIAVPWQSFDIRQGDDANSVRVVLDTTKEKLEAAPNFKADEWPIVGRRDWAAKTHQYFNANSTADESGTGGWGRGSAFHEGWGKGKDVTIQGTVAKIEKKSLGKGMAEGMCATVQGADGQERLVTLGPAWYMTQQGQLKEGDKVTVQAREWPSGNATVTVAQSVTTDRGVLALREKDGGPVWDTYARAERGMGGPGAAGDASGAVYARASDLRGKDIQGTTDGGKQGKIGDIDDLAVDTKSGRIPFVIASFGGFLGLGDSKVALPWRALDLSGDGKMYTLNVDESKLKNAPKLSDKSIASLNDPAFRQQVYSYYGIQPFFATYEQPTDRGEKWDRSSPIAKAYSTTETVKVTGPVSKVTTENIRGMGQATVVTVDAPGGAQPIVLGPSWFLDRQDFRLSAGDKVTVTAVAADVDGKRTLLATDFDGPNGRVVLKSTAGEPRWDAWNMGAYQDMRGKDREAEMKREEKKIKEDAKDLRDKDRDRTGGGV
jgi:sporulation protein YlmC with PRC-barrel domain